MAAINFPDSPASGDSAYLGGFTWIYDGASWKKLNVGKSAYAIAVDNGFSGTESEWLTSLIGETGATGATGPQGEQGPAGSDASLTRSIRTVTADTALVSGDMNQIIRFNGTSAQVLTVNDVLDVGSSVEIIQDNSGSVELQSGSGVNLLSSSGNFTSKGQNGVLKLRCVASGEYRVTGDVYVPNAIVATGGTMSTDATYTYHTFTSSGTLAIASGSGDIEYVVIAGGGAGGYDRGGGGGAGGVITGSYTPIAGNSYTITVGAGAPTHTGYITPLVSGGNSTAFGQTAIAGGHGNWGGNGGGTAGGSGGGAGSGTNSSGGAATSGQGYAGGSNTGDGPGGGGGGAGAAGGNGSANGQGANGGNGIQLSDWATATSTGVSGYYAGGGGTGNKRDGVTAPAGLGGLGGGGNGGTGSAGAGAAGAVNTGSGGGGGANISQGAGGAGGSGIVIVRYPTNG